MGIGGPWYPEAMLLLWIALLGTQDCFPLADGHTWTYGVEGVDGLPDVVKRVSGREKVGDVECFVLEDKGYPGDLQKMFLRVLPGELRVERLRRELETPFSWLKLPLEKGKRWSAALRRPGGDDGAELEFTVAGVEEVKVPAGTYPATRVDVVGSEDKKSALLELSFWLAPDVGEVRRTLKLTQRGKVELERRYVLKRFEPGPTR